MNKENTSVVKTAHVLGSFSICVMFWQHKVLIIYWKSFCIWSDITLHNACQLWNRDPDWPHRLLTYLIYLITYLLTHLLLLLEYANAYF